MTRGIQALQFFDMFSYNYFVNATEEDMKDMQCLLIYVGFNKARERPPTIIGTCKIIQTIFNGELPDKIEDWMGFYNIGRKIASLIMSDALGFFLFLVVDTHLEQVLPALGWTELKKATDIAIEIEEWLQPKLLKETNESIVGIRQLYRSSTKPDQLYIREQINKIKTISWTQLLVGLKHK